ncbi:MAG: type II toxin-antitoxin system RelE/ParE family toxin [Flavobacteriales bacterium]|nr:type II toxin-antitoxin system RelE/ParE family toxin [Flavobacteriales bacterium]
MSFRLEVRDRASNEFIEGYLLYENQRDGLGEEFHDEVQEHFAFLLQRPEGFAKWRGPFKKINLQRFPYIIVFRVVKSTVIIFSVFHSKRDPKGWGRRH